MDRVSWGNSYSIRAGPGKGEVCAPEVGHGQARAAVRMAAAIPIVSRCGLRPSG